MPPNDRAKNVRVILFIWSNAPVAIHLLQLLREGEDTSSQAQKNGEAHNAYP